MKDQNHQPGPFARLRTGGTLWADDRGVAARIGALLSRSAEVQILTEETPVLKGSGPLIIVMASPAEALCVALQEEVPASTALEKIAGQLTAILALWRQARQKVIVVDRDMLRQAPQSFFDRCHAPLSPDDKTALAEALPAEPDPILLALARDRIRADAALDVLAGAFSAASQPYAAGDPDQALERFLTDWPAEEECILLRAQQRSMYAQLDTLYGAKSQLAAQLEQAQTAQHALLEELAPLRSAKDQAQALEKEMATQSQEIDGLRQEIDRLYQSRSFRMMAPLRAVRRILLAGR